ncbi:copper amine oxidase N-terminal domain-containing protein [Paenibacillus sp. GCM10027629]|uniref:copper amine oxidase N-terminal domain-containing protein n=1 Tax=Paenibacillus sp. GCM10027629 TaxID=3273414 RepID=UPI0036423E77
MKKQLFTVCVSMCLLLLGSAVSFAANAKGTEIIVNGVKLNARATVIEGTTFIPYRSLFEAMGAKIGFDKDAQEISAEIDGGTMYLWMGEDIVEYKNKRYFLPEPIRTIEGSIYVPLRFIGEALGYQIVYNQDYNRITFTKFGYGADDSIRKTLTGYLQEDKHKPLSDLFSQDYPYPDILYVNEASESFPRVFPIKNYETWVNKIEYLDNNTAVVHAGYSYETQVLNESSETRFVLNKEKSGWKISKMDPIHLKIDVPKNIDVTADGLLVNKSDQIGKVLQDLNTYYTAMNEKNYETAIKSISPTVIKKWNEKVTYGKYEDIIKEEFNKTITTHKLMNARVLYVDQSHAVVNAKVEFTQRYNGDSKVIGPHVYDLLISMDWVDNDRWTYYSEYDLDANY